MSGELAWTSYQSDPFSSGPSMPPPQVQSRQEQYSPDQLNALMQQGNQGGPGQGTGNVPAKTTEGMTVSDNATDISQPTVLKDLVYIFIAVLAIDVLVLVLTRFYPEVFGRNLNRWYDLFGLNAVLADVGILFIGFLLARYAYSWFVAPKIGWNAAAFTGVTVAIQLIHDVLFYIGIIQPIPRGHNLMMDVFKDYAASGGAKILVGDAAMMVGSSVLAMTLKTLPGHIVASFAAIVGYTLPYILYTRNIFTVLR